MCTKLFLMVTHKDATIINEEFLCLSKYVSIQPKAIKNNIYSWIIF